MTFEITLLLFIRNQDSCLHLCICESWKCLNVYFKQSKSTVFYMKDLNIFTGWLVAQFWISCYYIMPKSCVYVTIVFLQLENVDLCDKIHQERQICIAVKVQNRMMQQRNLELSGYAVDDQLFWFMWKFWMHNLIQRCISYQKTLMLHH